MMSLELVDLVETRILVLVAPRLPGIRTAEVEGLYVGGVVNLIHAVIKQSTSLVHLFTLLMVDTFEKSV